MKMNLGILGLFTICFVFMPVLLAEGKPKVGQKAPDFGEVNWVMNAPETDSIEYLKGDVIILELWGTC